MKMVKRSLISMLSFLVFLSVLSIPLSVSANEADSFTDTKGHWAEQSINKVVQEGLFNGVADNSFEPQGSMTRAMFITVLHRLADKLDGPNVVKQNQTFTDVPANAWYAEALNWAVSADLTNGYGNGTFGPNDLLNREQITVLMIRFLEGYMGYDLSGYKTDALFTDDQQISSWAKEAVYKAVALGLVQGESGNAFNAKGTANRAVVAVITERFLTKSSDLKANQPGGKPEPTATPAPTATPDSNSNPGQGGGNNGGNSGTIQVTSATIQRNDTNVTDTAVRSGDKLTVAIQPANAQATVKWFVNGKVKSEEAAYTVQALDVGAVIIAEVTGTGSYSGTVTSASTGKVLAAVDLTNNDSNSAPVVVAENTVYKDEQGNEVTLSETDTISFSITASESEVPVTEKENVAANLQEQYQDPDLDIEQLSINYFAIDAQLLVESEEGSSTAIHPVGKTTLTLSKANLGFAANEDISQHVFLIGHTNKDGVQENVLGEVVEINGEQYVRIELNGLSLIFIGNIPPLTLTFDTAGGSEVAAKKVKLGEITPEVAAPVKNGYFFIGWNVDLNTTPIYRDMTITALWLEGAYLSAERLSLVDANGIEVENYSVSANGTVKIALSDSISYDSNLTYTLSIEAPENAVSYVLSDSGEAAAAAKVDAATDLSGNVEISVAITNADGQVLTGKYPSFIKWFDENEEAIVLEAVTVTVETDERAATREKTFNINRGIGTVETLLTAKSAEIEDYYAYLNGSLVGDAISNKFNIYLNSSFDKYPASGKLGSVDYANYSGIKLIFTPFEGESYADQSVKISAYYWDASSQQKTIEFNSKLTEEGQLEVTTKDIQDLKNMAGTSSSLYVYVTVEVGGRSQQVNLNLYGVNEGTSGRKTENISTDKWSEVVSALAQYNDVSVYYYGPDVTLDKELVLKEYQHLNITSNLTIDSNGVLRVVGSQYGGGNVYVRGDILVSSGGKITTNSQLETQRSYYYTSVRANGLVTIASGGEITVPEVGLLNVSGNEGFNIEQSAALNVNGDFASDYDVKIDGALNITGANLSYTSSLKGNARFYGDITVNNVIEINNNGNLWVSGMTTVETSGKINLIKGVVSLNGKTYNNGNISVQEGNLTLSNVGYAVNNDGTMFIDAKGKIGVPGTTLVNNGEITGSGAILLSEDANVAANYDNGIEYVIVEDEVTTSNYSRYRFVRDPKATATGIIYESKISGTGTLAQSIEIIEAKIPNS